jgi:hypothetical protein
MLKSFKSLLGNSQGYLKKKTVPEKETVFFIFKEIIKQEFDKRASDIFQEWLHENYNELIINGTLIAEQDDKTVDLIPKEKAA